MKRVLTVLTILVQKFYHVQDLLDYFGKVKTKIMAYLDGLNDFDLYDHPKAINTTGSNVLWGR